MRCDLFRDKSSRINPKYKFYTLYFSHNEEFYFLSLFIFYILISILYLQVSPVLLLRGAATETINLRAHCEVYKGYALRVKYNRLSRYVYIYIYKT